MSTQDRQRWWAALTDEKVARLVGIFANLGVVAGFAVLIIQVNQANNLAGSDAIQRRTSAIQETMQQFALSGRLAAIYGKASGQGLGALDSDDKARMQAWETARMYRMHGQYQQFKLGLLDRVSAENMLKAAAWYSRTWWKPLGVPVADPDFVAAIDKANPVKPPGAMGLEAVTDSPRQSH